MRDARPSRTAQYVLATRAILTARGLLDDPYAAPMLVPSMRIATALLTHRPLRRLSNSPLYAALAARITFFDDEVKDALHNNVPQVVIIGAGYDSRSWRFAHRGVQYFEMDHPATQADKRRRAPTGGPTYVAVDLRADDPVAALRATGFEWTRPALFVIEGVTMYLTACDVRTLLTTLADHAAPASRLAVNFAAPPGSGDATDRRRQRVLRLLGSARSEPHQFFLRDADVEEFVAQCGWNVTRVALLRDMAVARFARTPLEIDGINPVAACAAADLQG